MPGRGGNVMSWRVRSMPFGLLVAALVLWLGSPTVWAQGVVPSSAVEFEGSEIFRPTTGGGDYVTVYDSDTLPTKTPGARRFHLGVYGDYPPNPLQGRFGRRG